MVVAQSPPRRLQLARLAKAVVAALAVVGIGWSFTLHRETPDTVINRGEVESVSPADNSPVVPSQSTVSADLAFGLQGVLVIDGVRIPEDQTDVIVAQAVYSFTPGPGKEIRRFAGGGHVATVRYWRTASGSEEAATEYTWRFNTN
jgi:hypothetical protein